MSYLVYYLLEILIVFAIQALTTPFVCWCLGYIVLYLAIRNKDPMDPRCWLFVGVNILLINGFSGILNVPAYINPTKVLILTSLTILCFHLGFGKMSNRCYDRNIKSFGEMPLWIDRINIICGIGGIIGCVLVCYEMYVVFGVSLDDGGERRRQFQELFPFMKLTPIGNVFLGGSFVSIFSVFCGGGKKSQFLGLINMFALAFASMAIAGKQGLMFVVLILVYVYVFKKKYRINIVIPKYVKVMLLIIFYFFSSYLIFLTMGRQNVSYEGELLENGKFNKEFVTFYKKNLPLTFQNTFAEFFGYYGNQFPYVAERWELEGFENKYGYFCIPRILGLFTFAERQVKKVYPQYDIIYPDDRVATINNQRSGYYGNSNWGTVVFLNIKYFGIIGGLVFFFFYAKCSRYIYDRMFTDFNYFTFQMNFINCAGMFYFTMFYFTQETGPFIHLLLLLLLIMYKNIKVRKYV